MKIKMMVLSLTLGFTASASFGQSVRGSAGTAYMVSDAHLDTQWNWDVQTTINDYLPKTMRQNFYLFSKYPNYIFNFEGGIKYWWMKEYYPHDFELVKEYVAKGRWHLTGSSWDANETVICSPESWLRNILLGQTFFRGEFGKEGTDVFLPDCFGFGYDMPTLMAHCGLVGFSSQKLGWRTNPFYSDGRKYPFPVGIWEGIDGSKVMMVHGFNYSQSFKDKDLSYNKMLQDELKESTVSTIYRYYGTGDTGGSPSIQSVQAMENGLKGDGPVKIISATSDRLYHDFMPFDKHPELPQIKGEMTMDVHGSGCYTSEAAMKLYNRQNEHLGDAAERTAVMAEWLGQKVYPQRDMTDHWRRMIWNQFHDDLPGTCIPRAYEFAWNDELLSLKGFSNVIASSVDGISRTLNTNVRGTPVILYNNESFPVSTIVRLQFPSMVQSYEVSDTKGKKVPSQVVTDADGNKTLLVEASLQSVSASVYSVKTVDKVPQMKTGEGVRQIENAVYRLRVNNNGDIESILDKRFNQELVAPGKAFGLVVFDDCKSDSWPAWEILKATIDQKPVDVGGAVIRLVEDGPVRKTLCVDRHYGESSIRQLIHLNKGVEADRVDVENIVDWNSQNALLKAQFCMNVSNPKASYDLGLGYIQRSNNTPQAYEVYAHEWTDLTATDNSYGITILNDSKYGWDKPDNNTLRLSLLYSPKVSRRYTYQARQDLGHHVFTYSIVGHSGALDVTRAVRQSTVLNSPVRGFIAPKHEGNGEGRVLSFVSCDNPNVMIHALKKAETGNEYIVRVYEHGGKGEQTAHLSFAGSIMSAHEADGTEKIIGPAEFAGKKLTIRIKPFSVKTYRFTLNEMPVVELPTEVLPLPYNLRCFSPNGFRAFANFDGGYSYASELLPKDGLLGDGIPFRFVDTDTENGMVCKGNVVKLPGGGQYNKVYILAASRKNDETVTFRTGKKETTVTVPRYCGFIGQWGHKGHTTGFCKEAEVAYVGTHRHSSSRDEAYEFTYMFKYGIDIPKGVREIVFPDNQDVVIFSATLAREPKLAQSAGSLFRTSNVSASRGTEPTKPVNLLAGAKVIASSGHMNEHEVPENLIDGRENTKWCDGGNVPLFVDLDLGSVKPVKGWRLLNAGSETNEYITRTCLLQGRMKASGEWKTLDILDSNRVNDVTRIFSPVNVRYLRLFVVSPEQGSDGAARVYELEVY